MDYETISEVGYFMRHAPQHIPDGLEQAVDFADKLGDDVAVAGASTDKAMEHRGGNIEGIPERDAKWTRNVQSMRHYLDTLPRDIPVLGDGDITWNWARYPFVRMELDTPTAVTLYQPTEGQIGVLIVEPLSDQYILLVSWEGHEILYADNYPTPDFTEKTIVTILFENGQYHVTTGEYT